MNHWKARRLVAALPDSSLPPVLERELRTHVSDCARCRQSVDELRRAETLLQRMPASILPLERNPATHHRLVSLARWSEEPDLPDPERWNMPALGLAGILATLALIATVGSWTPLLGDPARPTTLAPSPPESAFLPVAWRPFR